LGSEALAAKEIKVTPHDFLVRLYNLKLAAPLAVLLALVAVTAIGFVSSSAQSTQKEEREIEDRIPKHLPIKIKIKNAEKVKDLGNEDWARDFEIEVENRSDKPIYYMRLLLDLPDVRDEGGLQIRFPLRYGRIELVSYLAPLEPGDVPIKPGDSYTFRIAGPHREGWEMYAGRRGMPRGAPRKLRLIFGELNFGDGTGFHTRGGLPIDVNKKRAGTACGEGGGKSPSPAVGLNGPPEHHPALLTEQMELFLPATFLPVIFSPEIFQGRFTESCRRPKRLLSGHTL
jgi:hypothetical protein